MCGEVSIPNLVLACKPLHAFHKSRDFLCYFSQDKILSYTQAASCTSSISLLVWILCWCLNHHMDVLRFGEQTFNILVLYARKLLNPYMFCVLNWVWFFVVLPTQRRRWEHNQQRTKVHLPMRTEAARSGLVSVVEGQQLSKRRTCVPKRHKKKAWKFWTTSIVSPSTMAPCSSVSKVDTWLMTPLSIPSFLWTLTACKICLALLLCGPCGPADVKPRLRKAGLPPCFLGVKILADFNSWKPEIHLPFSRIAHLPACVRFWLVGLTTEVCVYVYGVRFQH